MANLVETLIRKPQRRFLQSEVAVSKILSYLTTIPDPDLLLSKAGIQRYQLRQLELGDEVAQAKDTRVEAVVSAPYSSRDKEIRNTYNGHNASKLARIYGLSERQIYNIVS